MQNSGSEDGGDSVGATVAPWLRTRGVLLHVGPAKTGTTALQTALAARRPELAESGILYPGSRPQHGHAALAVQQRQSSWHEVLPTSQESSEPISTEPWQELLDEVGGRADKAIVSAEGFAASTPAMARTIITDLGGESVQVLFTARPIGRVAPSIWQQRVKAGETRTYADWLADVLSRPESREWLQPEILVNRWAELVGHENVAVLLTSPDSPAATLRTFEDLAGITPGLLQPDRSNRSMTAAESELVRRLWIRILEQPEHLPEAARQIRRGVGALVEGRTPPPGETRLETPPWALAELADLETASLAALSETGCHLVGDDHGYATHRGAPAGDHGSATPTAAAAPESTAASTHVTGPTPELAVDALYAFVAQAAKLDATRQERLTKLRKRVNRLRGRTGAQDA